MLQSILFDNEIFELVESVFLIVFVILNVLFELSHKIEQVVIISVISKHFVKYFISMNVISGFVIKDSAKCVIKQFIDM